MILQIGYVPKVKAKQALRLLTAVFYSIVIFASCTVVRAADTDKACGLLTQAEVAAVVGPVNLNAGPVTETGSICLAYTPEAMIVLTLKKLTGTERDPQVIDKARKMGAQVEFKTFGPITCSSVIFPSVISSKDVEQKVKDSAQINRFTTSCEVLKGNQVAQIGVTAKSAKDMVSIEKLRSLAEKMTPRF